MYILVDLSFNDSSLVKSIIDGKCLKAAPFSAKYSSVAGLEYKNVLIEIVHEDTSDQEYLMHASQISLALIRYGNSNIQYSGDLIYSLYLILKDVLQVVKYISINPIRYVNIDNIGIFYSDGSSNSKINAASFGCCKLLNESSKIMADEETDIDSFTNKLWDYEMYAGRIEDGTNNIGELSGIRFAINNLSDKPIQVIISDSEYGIKCYREYIYNWMANGYRAYNKKEIKNKQLIIDTYNELHSINTKKIVLFKWTKGHSNDVFNEICDELAKGELEG